ncbi:EAL and HDOD domain-containing protein [Paraglaciecola chathamensis]|uniref:EAL and HDOD domain-containing protein n=1 Tax=Paraglaciecola chathamensis TaxID=368405 RepID=UPI0026FC81F3|nr:HDOD domain-containing protein [Paraglaciecola chathamensis]MDO6559832.1 HDOD domain-containing protein [Paraglaciecola chathamensis]
MNFYAARQPILHADKSLFAYELLFRDSLENTFPNINEDEATAKMVASLQFNLGLDSLLPNTLAFINFTHNSLLDGYPLMLPKEQIVVEILETVKPGKKLLNACVDLKEKGYIIALDDYIHQNVWLHFYPYVDIIKIDYQETSHHQILQIIEAIKPFPNIKLLAEKIENHQEYLQALEYGCCYFQGYFFSKPELIKNTALTPSQMAIAKLMAEMAKEEPNIKLISQAFESDVSLSFKLLRYAQSPIFKRTKQIETIKQAIVVLGQNELRRFVSLLFTAQFSEGKPAELTVMSLSRAHYCELLTEYSNQRDGIASAFLVGLLSLLDAMLDADIAELMAKLPISQAIKDSIVLRQGEQAQYLMLSEFFENGQWSDVNRLCENLDVNFDDAFSMFQRSQLWAKERLQALT